jgi:hypothetical protein
VLGSYNDFCPVADPVTGETVHLFGFQAVVSGEMALSSKGNYYPGAMYAFRTADGSYSVREINGTYSPGKPALIAARTFALSPFGDNRLFVGGNDTNFYLSTDMAWIFSADLSVVL